MSIISPEIEYVDHSGESLRYLEHGWPSDLCRWHSHEEYELHLIVSTSGKAFIGDYIGDFSSGALYLIGPHLPHNWITDQAFSDSVELRDMLVQFNQESLDHLASAFPEFCELEVMFKQAHNGLNFVGFDAEVAHSYLATIRDSRGADRIVAFLKFLLEANRHADRQILSCGGIAQFEPNSKHARVANIVDYISKNYAEDLSLPDIAQMAGMSAAAFSRHFQKVTGKRFVDFVIHIRIAQACSLLYACDEQISSICFHVGFQNLANFNRHFLKVKNMTPTEYRKTARRELLPHGGVRA